VIVSYRQFANFYNCH